MNKLDSILQESKEIKDFRIFDVEAEWNQFQELVSSESEEVTEAAIIKTLSSEKNSGSKIRYILSIAASLILIVSVLFLLQNPEKTRDTLVTTSMPDTLKIVDGTMVYLAENSTLEYPLTLSKTKVRKISLNGNATFDVAEDKTLPFHVYYGDILVEVLGTVFTISKSKNFTVIKNIDGTVKVAQILNKDNFVILNKGDEFLYKNGLFTNVEDTIVIEQVEKIEEKKAPSVKIIEKKEAGIDTRSTYKLGSVIKDHLLKYHKDKVKLKKKAKIDMDARVKLDISMSYQAIIKELEKQNLISFEKGDCADCFVILTPVK